MHDNRIRPRFGKLAAAIVYSGRSRSRLYQLAAENRGLIRKDGASTLIDFDVLDRILDALPIAEIGPQRCKSDITTNQIESAADLGDDAALDQPSASMRQKREAQPLDAEFAQRRARPPP